MSDEFNIGEKSEVKKLSIKRLRQQVNYKVVNLIKIFKLKQALKEFHNSEYTKAKVEAKIIVL